jgi:hypothetical protein
MSESRTSSDSILPKLHTIIPVEQKVEPAIIEKVGQTTPTITKPVRINRKANKQLGPSGIPAPKFEITSQMRN